MTEVCGRVAILFIKEPKRIPFNFLLSKDVAKMYKKYDTLQVCSIENYKLLLFTMFK